MRVVALALSGGALLSASAPAGAVPFGTNLDRQPAEDAPVCPFFQPFDPANSQSCAWQSVNLQTGESPFPPTGNGVVTQVRVRVGNSTGPMQMVVLRGLRSAAQVPSQGGPIDPRDPNGPQFFTPGSQAYVCCKAVGLSQAFTPAPNAVTTVAVNLPTRNDLAPDPRTGVYVGDFLALQILAPNVRVPVASDAGAIAGGFFPAWQFAGEERAGVYGQTGGSILFNGDWTPTGGGDRSGLVTAPPGLMVGRLTSGALPVQVPGPGTLRVADAAQGRARAARDAAAKRTSRSRIVPVVRKVGKAGTVKIRIKPSAYGGRTLRRSGRLKLTLTVAFTPPGSLSATKTNTKITLTRRATARRR
jgi:hypothetical protein